MTDDIGLAKKTMLIGDTAMEIVEPLSVDVVYADVYTELRVYNGVVHLSLAAICTDGVNIPELRIVSRIRLSEATWANIQTGFERQAAAAAEAKQAAN